MSPGAINEGVNRGQVIASVGANDINKYLKIENIIRNILSEVR
jgi:hypothetical protein